MPRIVTLPAPLSVSSVWSVVLSASIAAVMTPVLFLGASLGAAPLPIANDAPAISMPPAVPSTAATPPAGTANTPPAPAATSPPATSVTPGPERLTCPDPAPDDLVLIADNDVAMRELDGAVTIIPTNSRVTLVEAHEDWMRVACGRHHVGDVRTKDPVTRRDTFRDEHVG